MCGKNKPYSHSSLVVCVSQSECLIDTNINREKPTAIIHIERESQKLWILKLHNELILEEKKIFLCVFLL